MSRIAYVNGRYIPHRLASVAIDDRGYQFADGVYEVIEVAGEALVDEEAHLQRLRRSVAELFIAWPTGEPALRLILREVVKRNRVRDGLVYLQITRGVAPRDHVFPAPAVRPALVVTARAADPAKADAKAAAGIRVVTMPDLRWKRPDIKSISLLPNVLAKAAAKARGAGEAWLVTPEGWVSEGAASNAWIIVGERRVVTHPSDGTAILKGITRTTLLAVLRDSGLDLDERPFSVAEAYEAREAFVTGATSLVLPVVAIDDHPIGDGRPGPIATALRARFHQTALRSPIR